jgi:hypothetical protein
MSFLRHNTVVAQAGLPHLGHVAQCRGVSLESKRLRQRHASQARVLVTDTCVKTLERR